jgi:hypothetical protein
VYQNVRAALESRLATWAAANSYALVPVGTPGTPETPSANLVYPSMAPVEPGAMDTEGRVVEGGGLFRARLSTGLNAGPGGLTTAADGVVSDFFRNTTLISGGVTVTCLNAWAGEALQVGGRLELAVSVRWRAFLTNS